MVGAALHGEREVGQQRAEGHVLGAAGSGHHAALGRADQVIVTERPPVRVERRPRLQDYLVHAALRVGELHLVSGLERAALSCLHCVTRSG